MKIAGFTVHKYAEIFPMMDGPAFDALVEDIAAFGLLEPVVIAEGKILDGRNRAKACLKAGVEIETWDYDGDDPLGYVVSCNLHRRHLDESQRAMVAARLATLKKGANQHRPNGPPSQDEAAETMKTSTRSVKRARKVLESGDDDLVEAVDGGKLSVSKAAKIAEMPKKDRKRVLAGIEGGKSPARAVRDVNKSKVRKTDAAEEIKGRYQLIYADPPWSYNNSGLTGAAEDHYPTMSTEDICALPISKKATKNAVLLMWVTNPLLEDAIRVCAAWGFTYKTNYVWVKNRGTPSGFHNRGRHELLFVCTRGSGVTIDPENLKDSVIKAPVGKHSAKPLLVYDMIEELYPDMSKLELFCRKPRDGWTAWGNEVDVK